jgi:hypothetical protein
MGPVKVGLMVTNTIVTSGSPLFAAGAAAPEGRGNDPGISENDVAAFVAAAT